MTKFAKRAATLRVRADRCCRIADVLRLPALVPTRSDGNSTVSVWRLAAFIAVFAALIALFLGALAIIFVFWDTHRGAVSLAMIAGFLGIAAAAALTLRSKLRSKPPLLDDTLAELAKDRDQLRTPR